MATRKELIDAGVRNLKEFGYPHANADNIITDPLYSKFFLRMLRENLGLSADKPIKALISEIETARKAED